MVDIDKESLKGISRSVRLRVTLDLKKPMKRGTKIKFGDSGPCWLPVTYERLPSFCYWCGKLGHSCKDCSSMHEKEDRKEEIDMENLPYGDWMRASPIKSARVMDDRDGDSRDIIRKSLFSQVRNTKSVDIAETSKDNINTTEQITELLEGFQNVEVSMKESLESKQVQEEKITSTASLSPNLPLKLSTQNMVHQATKTVHPNTTPSLIPISDLVKMVQASHPSTNIPLFHTHPINDTVISASKSQTIHSPKIPMNHPTIPKQPSQHHQTANPTQEKTQNPNPPQSQTATKQPI